MGILSRLFKVGQSEAHSVVDKLENPIKMTEQGIRDMKNDLSKSIESLAEVKSLAIRSKRELELAKGAAESYENKALLLLKKAEQGEITQDEADRLASEALMRKDEKMQDIVRCTGEIELFENSIAKLDVSVKKLKSNISHYENELKTLVARSRVSEATKKINKSLSGVDSNSTIAMLEKMKEKVDQQESIAEAYGDIASSNKSIDDEIDEVLKDNRSHKASAALEALKAKMNK